MPMFLLSLVFVATAFFIGVLVLHTISIIALSILARAEQPSRYVRLASRALPLPGTRTIGRRIRPLLGASGYALTLATVAVG
ncbi:MAG: hypothetical protein ACLQFF_10955 [Steroidobacteraceae bacterium]|jgi:hypothetical protein